MSLRESLTDVGFKALNKFHRVVLHASGGRVGGSAFGMPIVELLTVGRRSGLIRSTMLTVPVVEGDRYVLVASKGGDDRDPDWYRNILASADVELTVGGQRRPMRARVASQAETVVLWPRVVSAYKPYDGYRRRARRDVPLVICEPRRTGT